MESDSPLAIMGLVLSLLAFLGVSIAWAAFHLTVRHNGLPWPEHKAPTASVRWLLSRYERTVFLFTALRVALLMATARSLTTWTAGIDGFGWVQVALMAVGLVFFLTVGQGAIRSLGRAYPRIILLVASPLAVWASRLLGPVLWAAERTGAAVGARTSEEEPARANSHLGSQDEGGSSVPVEEVLDANPEERRMIRAILELEDVTAREVMVPRVDIVAVEADTPLHHVASSMAQGGHSRIPVFKETIDNIVGVVHARDVLQSMVSGNDPGSLTELSRTPLFIPESKPLDELLRELRETRVSIAIVVDEYGGTEGVLTIEDLLEEIVGEIEDEFQTEEPPVIKLTESEAIVDGRVNLEELNDLFQTSLEGDGFDTLAGLLSSHLGRIPVPGDTLDLEGLAMRVLSTSGRRVRKVSVAQHP